VDLRAGVNDMQNLKFLTLPGPESRLLGRPARSQSPYRLRYRDSLRGITIVSGCREVFPRGAKQQGHATEHSYIYSQYPEK
jgi:hypothetical protein